MKKIKNILMINFGGIGDEILFLPTIKTVKASYPDAKIALVLEPRSKSIYDLTDMIDDVIGCDIKSKDKYSNIIKFLLQVWSKKFDMVISSGGSKSVSILLALTGIKRRYGYNAGKLSELLLTKAVPLNQKQYAVNMYHDLVAHLGDNPQVSLPEVYIKDEYLVDAKEILNTDKKVILIHPGVSQMSIQKKIFKFWDAQNWTELIYRLCQNPGYSVVLTGGKDDADQLEKIIEELAKRNCTNLTNLYGKTKNIGQLAALIKLADVMVCVDSAPMHIAVGTNTKTAALFMGTDEKKLLPDSERFIAITNKNIDCRPCLWDKRQTSCDTKECLDIKVEDVFEAIQKLAVMVE